MSNVAIEVNHVWKRFRRGEIHDSLRDFLPAMARRLMGRGPKQSELRRGDFWALKDVSFEVRRGDVLGIIGPNGAGKSTLLKILARILKANRGTIRVDGRLRALIEVGAGFHPDLTGRENVFLNGSILGMKQKEIRGRFDQIVEFAGVEEFIDTPVKRYSSGMMARLGFAIAAHMDPEILLVDEVLSVGDAAFRAKCIAHLETLLRSDVSVIFISHNLEHVRHLCDRCLVLDRGEVRILADVSRACEEYYACFENVEPRENDPDAGSEAPGQIVGLGVRDERGEPSFRVQSHRPVVLEITYELFRSVEQASFSIAFWKGAAKLMGGCGTAQDDFALPVAEGTHTVRLQIDGLPFAPGDYRMTMRLEADGSVLPGGHVTTRPLTVAGGADVHWDIVLQHRWEVP